MPGWQVDVPWVDPHFYGSCSVGCLAASFKDLGDVCLALLVVLSVGVVRVDSVGHKARDHNRRRVPVTDVSTLKKVFSKSTNRTNHGRDYSLEK